jgi:hypothetical protein
MANDGVGACLSRWPRLLNPLRFRNRVLHKDRWPGLRIWHVGPALPL